ncbi:hypothetical protein BJ085DRAFT_31061 [Dimargaris cristalligena]|uniref:Uncharacterized protein n=1 Tax=Dimargaris cristalligena TaxID=215637 RepID=A0A4P9ZR70_9FUNG|nr:hypothetical protein BJ085DRAFT_31061 [Dimargaris cristalligena]|eukprot:RKP35887.1 hypothetical protein BJ085DRAFT_31061 [Dimargaris cristalligena]
MLANDPSPTSVLLKECNRYQSELLDLQNLLENLRLTHQEELVRAQREADELRLLNNEWKAKYNALLVQTDDQRSLLQKRLDAAMGNRAISRSAVLNLTSPIEIPFLREPSQRLTQLANSEGDGPCNRLRQRNWASLDHARFDQLQQEADASEADVAKLNQQVESLQTRLRKKDTRITELQSQLTSWLVDPNNKQAIGTRAQQLADQLLFVQQQNDQLTDKLETAQAHFDEAKRDHTKELDQAKSHISQANKTNTDTYEKLLFLQSLVAELEKLDLTPTPEPASHSPRTTVHPPVVEPDRTLLEKLSGQLTNVTQDRDNLRQLYEQVIRELQQLRQQFKTYKQGSSTTSPKSKDPPVLSQTSGGSPHLQTTSSPQPGTSATETRIRDHQQNLELMDSDIEKLSDYTRRIATGLSSEVDPPNCASQTLRPLVEQLKRLHGQLMELSRANRQSPPVAPANQGSLATDGRATMGSSAGAMAGLERAYLKLTAEHESVLNELKKLQSRSPPTVQHSRSADHTLPSSAVQRQYLSGEINDLLENFQQLTRDHEHLDESFKNAIEEVDRLRNSLKASDGQRESSEKYCQELKAECKRYQQDMSLLREQNKHISKSLASISAISDQIKADKAGLSKELLSLQDLLKATEMSKNEYKRNALMLTRDLEQLRTCLRQCEVERDSLTVQLRAKYFGF